MRISAVIITKNEEEIIRRCLDSVAFCDEVVLIDSQSTDRTREIAQRYTDKVYISGKGVGGDYQLGLENSKYAS